MGMVIKRGVLSLETLEEAVRESMFGEESPGYCTLCGCRVEGVEPDAVEYTCPACGRPSVYGAEEIMLVAGESLA